jgi:hypothetical protein
LKQEHLFKVPRSLRKVQRFNMSIFAGGRKLGCKLASL